ncbi:MAG: LSM domain-containing protein [Anaerolineae bacterium]|jgi:sRNA-binding regulator protein Hfq|nr:LSM domain-containing protein [Anaerolineae bacterium]MDH7475369.1 RNA chaperone Hfq [Anaerolineae bacterium]
MSNEKKKAKRNWGQNQAEYLAALEGKQVTVVFVDGKALKGELTGVDTYELFIKQSNGLEIMISKGTIKYLHPSSEE